MNRQVVRMMFAGFFGFMLGLGIVSGAIWLVGLCVYGIGFVASTVVFDPYREWHLCETARERMVLMVGNALACLLWPVTGWFVVANFLGADK